MRFLGRLGAKLGFRMLSNHFMVVPWIGLLIGIFFCTSATNYEFVTPIQQMHLQIFGISTKAVISDLTAKGDRTYSVTAGYLIKNADGSVMSVSRTRDTSSYSVTDFREGDTVEVVYSSRKPHIWMLGTQVNEIYGSGIVGCFGLFFVICGGGGVWLMQPKEHARY